MSGLLLKADIPKCDVRRRKAARPSLSASRVTVGVSEAPAGASHRGPNLEAFFAARGVRGSVR